LMLEEALLKRRQRLRTLPRSKSPVRLVRASCSSPFAPSY
jgi:hypothetical protein